MQSPYKEKILKELEEVPGEMMPEFYKIIHILATGLFPKKRGVKKRSSLRGIWKGSRIDDALLLEAKESLFPYERGNKETE